MPRCNDWGRMDLLALRTSRLGYLRPAGKHGRPVPFDLGGPRPEHSWNVARSEIGGDRLWAKALDDYSESILAKGEGRRAGSLRSGGGLVWHGAASAGSRPSLT